METEAEDGIAKRYRRTLAMWHMSSDANLADLDDAAFLHRFETRAIANAVWNHRCHVRMAFLYLSALPFPTAVERIRSGIKALNQVNGVIDSPTSGYHETVTVAWARLVSATIERHGPFANFHELAEANPHLLTKTLLRLYYSRERLAAAAARTTFVEPDVAALPIPLPLQRE